MDSPPGIHAYGLNLRSLAENHPAVPSKVNTCLQTDLPVPIRPRLNVVLSGRSVQANSGSGGEVHAGRRLIGRVIPRIGNLCRDFEVGALSVAQWKLFDDRQVPRI